MNDVFSDPWMLALAGLWNSDAEMLTDLERVGFDSVIGFGVKGEQMPRAILVVRNGKVEFAGRYDGRAVEWDLRADLKDWRRWLTEGFGLQRLGVSTATGKLKFNAGNYRKMVCTPTLARPFLRVFELMGRIETAWPD